MTTHILIAFRIPIGGDRAEALEDATKECRWQEYFWRMHGFDFHAYPGVIETERVPNSYETTKMLALARTEYPDVSFTNYQLHGTDDSRGQRGGRWSRVEATGRHWTSGTHETGHNILDREHAGKVGSRPYADPTGSIMASSRFGDLRLGS